MTGTALVFPGQGCAEDGMGVRLAEQSQAARAVFDDAERHLGMPVLDICRRGGPGLELTLHQQPAVLVCQLAHLASWIAQGNLLAAAAAGHSLGQLAALVAAGAIDRGTAFTLVAERARSMHAAGEATPGAMSAVLGWRAEAVMAVCARVSEEIWLAAVNGDAHVVISGSRESIQTAGDALLAAGADRVIPLAITIAAHSPVMQPAACRLRDLAAQLPVAAPAIPVPSNLDGRRLTTADDVRHEISESLVAPVQWMECMRSLDRLGIDRFVELSPRPTLVNTVVRALPTANVSCPGPEQLSRAPANPSGSL